MTLQEKIDAFLSKRSKAAMILELMLNREYVTCSDIIKFNCEGTPLIFTSSPHKLIETIRKHFGADFVQDREVKFYRNFYKKNGTAYKVSDTYKQYFLVKCEGV